ncbi:hypothetical protein ACSBR1_025032 [Camellia fascicularis]
MLLQHILDNKRGSSNAMAGSCGLGAGCSKLLSDMQAFKAANPGCILEDFIRWQSLPDWTEMEPSGEAKVTSNDVDLLSTKGNLWRELWETGKTVPAVKQAPLFDEDLAVGGRAATAAKATAVKVVKTGGVVTAATAAKATAGHSDKAEQPQQPTATKATVQQPRPHNMHVMANSAGNGCTIQFLGVVDHPNLVKLLGYCSVDGERGIQRLLVYEYMPNTSLEDHLFNRVPAILPWKTRLEIMLGAAQGLVYLHEELEVQDFNSKSFSEMDIGSLQWSKNVYKLAWEEEKVIYQDFKASNVLLDEDFKPKLSDSGLAREGPIGDRAHVSTAVGVYCMKKGNRMAWL